MLKKIGSLFVFLRRFGFKKTFSAVYYRLYVFFLRHVLKKDFIIKRIHDYKMKLPIGENGIKGIASALIMFGTREEDQLEIIRSELHLGMRVLDIGANIGYYSLLLESIVGSQGKVYSIEPSLENFALLKENIALNGKENVIDLFHLGVSDTEGTRSLYISEFSNSHAFFEDTRNLRKVADSDKAETEIVEMVSIDTFVSDKEPINFIRMDVEGYEVNVFKGMRSFAERTDHELKILFEVHRSRYDNDKFNMREEVEWLFKAGFTPKVLVAKPMLKSKPWSDQVFSERGYKPDHKIRTDGFIREVYLNIKNEDALDYVCSIGCVRALLLCRY